MNSHANQLSERMSTLGYRVSEEELKGADELVRGLESASVSWLPDADFSSAGSSANLTDAS